MVLLAFLVMVSTWAFQDRVLLKVRPRYLALFACLTLSLPNATVVEFTVHCQTRLQSKFKGTVESSLTKGGIKSCIYEGTISLFTLYMK